MTTLQNTNQLINMISNDTAIMITNCVEYMNNISTDDVVQFIDQNIKENIPFFFMNVEKSDLKIGYAHINYAAIFLMIFMLCISSFVFADSKSRNKSQTATFFASKSTKLNNAVVKNILEHVGDYSPPWWYNSHIGAIVPFGSTPNLKFVRQVYSDQHRSFAADWYPSQPDHRTNSNTGPLKICVFLPGLGLSSKNKFCQKFLQVIHDDGFYSVVVNAQGIELPLRKAKFWHPGHYHDAKAVLDFIHAHYPKSQVMLVGFSAGSNIVHKLATTYEHREGFIRCAVGVCVNGDYLKSRTRLESTLQGKIYSALVLLGYKDILMRNDHVHECVDPSALSRLTSARFVSEYDAIAWKYLYGFDKESDYYEAVSSSYADRNLNIPYLIIQPRDDPLHSGKPSENIPLQEFYENPNVIYMEPRYGNHFGFCEGPLIQCFTNQTSYTYPAKVAKEFFQSVISNQ